MGKHSSGGSGWRRPNSIDGLSPNSSSGESKREQRRRNKELAITPSERQRRRERRKRGLYQALAVFALLCVAAVALAFTYLQSTQVKLKVADSVGAALKKTRKEPQKPGKPFNMLLMGSDIRAGDTVARSDTLIFAHVDPEKKRTTLVSIPRDTRVRIPGYGREKVNAAMSLGGAELAIETVSEFTGQPIDHYMQVDFKGFQALVDALPGGGVWMDVPHTIKDKKAGKATVKRGHRKLNGSQALVVVRSRKYPEGDLERIRVQQAFLKACFKQTLQWSSVFKAKAIIDAAADHIKTDMTMTEMVKLAADMKGMKEGGIEAVTVPGAPKYVGGVSYVIADEEEFAAMMARIEAGEPAEEQTATAGTAEGPLPSRISVTVKNGAGVNGVASDAADRLRRAGFKVGATGNMNQFVYDTTLIVFKQDDRRAAIVREHLGRGEVVESGGLYSFTTDVLVIVGKDWPTSTSSGQVRVDPALD